MNAQTPIVIIGAGVAGLWTALNAAPRPCVVLSGAALGDDAATAWAQGGVAAALGRDDSPSLHMQDTIDAGGGLVSREAARILATEGPEVVDALAALGAPFDRDGRGAFQLSREAAHGRARVARVGGDGAGRAILGSLIAAARRASHVSIMEKVRFEDLCLSGDRVVGVRLRFGAHAWFQQAAAVVLASGGVSGLFAEATGPRGLTGDGLGAALAAGAWIRDPEFVQFHPTALDVGAAPAPLATEALRGDGATLVDGYGRSIMRGVHPDGDLAPRDVVARAVHRARLDGRGAYLDATRAIGGAFPDRFPAVFAACRRHGLDPRRSPMPVAPAAHYHMGGVETDLWGAASTPGLYAVGECAATGVHGANRLASNSLLEGLVFGRRLGHALKDAPAATRRTLTTTRPTPRMEGEDLDQLRGIMSKHVGVERDEAGLSVAIERLTALAPPDRPRPHALTAALAITIAARNRQESRGGHFRSDHPRPLDVDVAATRFGPEALDAALSGTGSWRRAA